MIWLLVCAVGFLAETSLIVVLGRQATGACPPMEPVAGTTSRPGSPVDAWGPSVDPAPR